MLTNKRKNVFSFLIPLSALISSNLFAQVGTELKITEFVNNVPKVTNYSSFSSAAQDTDSSQVKSYINPATGLKATISFVAAPAGSASNGRIMQGYYPSTGNAADGMSVKISAPEFGCAVAQTGAAEVKAFKKGSTKIWIKGELICQDSAKKKIAYDFGSSSSYEKPQVTNYAVTASSQQTGFEASKLASGGSWKSGLQNAKETLTFNFPSPIRMTTIDYSMRRNFSKVVISGAGANSNFSYTSTLTGYPNDMASFQVSSAAWTVEPAISSISVTIDKQRANDAVEFSQFKIKQLKYSPWQNQALAYDANGDGSVGPLDALIVINFLNSSGDKSLPAIRVFNDSRMYFDVNGDGAVGPIDVLQIINYLNSGGR